MNENWWNQSEIWKSERERENKNDFHWNANCMYMYNNILEIYAIVLLLKQALIDRDQCISGWNICDNNNNNDNESLPTNALMEQMPNKETELHTNCQRKKKQKKI